MLRSSFIASAVIEVVFLNTLLLIAGIIGIGTHGWQPMDWVWLMLLMGFGITRACSHLGDVCDGVIHTLDDMAREKHGNAMAG